MAGSARFVPPAKDLVDRMISVLFNPNINRSGSTTDLIERRRNRVEQRARNLAPVREGTLRASHTSTAPRKVGDRIISEVINFADHAIFVHEGTSNTSGPNLWEGWGPWGGAEWFAPNGVAGQSANPWLVRAYNEVASQDTRTTKFGRLREANKKRGDSPGGVQRRPI